MTHDEIIELARQTSSHGVEHRSGEVSFVFYNEHLEAFAKLVDAKATAKEREACCAGEIVNSSNIMANDMPHTVIEKYRAAIQARGEA